MNIEETLFSYFRQISAIPRASYKEAKIAEYLMDFAQKHSLTAIRDKANNVLIRKSASSGCESAPTVLLQGHTDMVCEKNAATEHDFDREGIRLIRDGDYLRADGTTLGADDGYAVAAMLSVLSDDTIRHPALECLFTTSEEVGMDGMREFDKNLLRARLMINLDSCEESYATASCAGGVRSSLVRSCTPEPFHGTILRLFVSGLAGGHSGEEIDKERGNALKISARLLNTVAGESGFSLISAEGGNKDNAIPRECSILFTVSDRDTACASIRREAAAVAAELTEADRAFSVTVTEEAYSGSRMDRSSSVALTALLRVLPCGPQHMSAHVSALVETSVNTAVLRASPERCELTLSSRSSVETRLDDLCSVIAECASLCGFSCEHRGRYPAWSFRDDSRIQEVYSRAFRDCFGKDAKIIGIHAGLECGLLSREIPDMDMISIGPDMYDIHTPAERLSVPSAVRMYDLLLHMLNGLAQA